MSASVCRHFHATQANSGKNHTPLFKEFHQKYASNLYGVILKTDMQKRAKNGGSHKNTKKPASLKSDKKFQNSSIL